MGRRRRRFGGAPRTRNGAAEDASDADADADESRPLLTALPHHHRFSSVGRSGDYEDGGGGRDDDGGGGGAKAPLSSAASAALAAAAAAAETDERGDVVVSTYQNRPPLLVAFPRDRAAAAAGGAADEERPPPPPPASKIGGPSSFLAEFGCVLLLLVAACVGFGFAAVRYFEAAAAAAASSSSSSLTETPAAATMPSIVSPWTAAGRLLPPYLADRRGGAGAASSASASPSPLLGMTYPSDPLPFSELGPAELGLDAHRRHSSRPGEVFGPWRRGPSSLSSSPSSSSGAASTTTLGSSASSASVAAIGGGEGAGGKVGPWTEPTSGGRPRRHRRRRRRRGGVAMPTNMWYENLLLGSVSEGRVTPNQRAYTIPYIVDFVGPVPGVRVQLPHVDASSTIVQMSTVERHGLTLGTSGGGGGVDRAYVVDEAFPPRQLGLGLRWSEGGCGRGGDDDDDGDGDDGGGDDDGGGGGARRSFRRRGKEQDEEEDEDEERASCPTMRTTVLRGIPYVTMEYSGGMVAVISAEVPLVGSPMIDGGSGPGSVRCGKIKNGGTSSAAATATATAKVDDANDDAPDVVRVEGEVSLTFAESDFTWLVFFSRPVRVSCYRDDGGDVPDPYPGYVDTTVKSAFELRVVEEEDDDEDEELFDDEGGGGGPSPSKRKHNGPRPLIVRAALSNNCTHGVNPLYCVGGRPREQTHLGDLLRAHADAYPGSPEIRYEFPSSATVSSSREGGEEASYALIHFDWRPRSMREDAGGYTAAGGEGGQNPDSKRRGRSKPSAELLAYALPHHTDSIQEVVGSTNSRTGHCSAGLHGRACLLRGNEWVMREYLDGPPSFAALRPPHHSAVRSLADAIAADIHFSPPDYYMKGAGDTYFSGKMLAKLGRIVVVASELKGLAETPPDDTFDTDDPSERELKLIVEEARKVDLPSEAEMNAALERLRGGVEVWLNGTAEARFLYDDDWGGLVNCGCLFNSETGSCDNEYPNCPAFSDPGLNFGNGFYNDHHFHYGYMIYAAAVVANYDLSWGRAYFQQVLALVRDIANPSIHDRYFPDFRHKDWFLGSSWASGIATIGGQPYLNGRNQESSSEAIHAYEAIGLYGAVMAHAWGDGVSSDVSENDKAKTASRVREMGRLLTATEIRSAQRYWHVLHGDLAKNTIYPKVYTPAVVGMMWDTMCQFQTWFGNAPYLSYGIQLMPLTSVSERRDAVKWVQQMYPPFAHSCEADRSCEEQGWSILQYAMLAVVGHRKLALEKAISLPASVFKSAGGNGHSLTNTLWYIATRPDVAEPLLLEHATNLPKTGEERKGRPPREIVCECPETCTEFQLGFDAGVGYTCGSRIRWLMTAFGKTEAAACRQVGGSEFPDACGGCDPDRCARPPPPPPETAADQKRAEALCPSCPPAVCKGETNSCPRSLLAPFLCLSGMNGGGCAQTPWIVTGDDSKLCTECCRLTEACFGV